MKKYQAQNISKIQWINDTYFNPGKIDGVDMAGRDFILDDFQRVVEDIIQEQVILKIISHRIAKSGAEKRTTGDGRSRARFIGFDSELGLPLERLCRTFRAGMVMNARKVIKEERDARESKAFRILDPGNSTAGDFVKDVSKLKDSDITEFLGSQEEEDIDPEESEKISQEVRSAITKSKKFLSKNYYASIIEQSEKGLFHKDREPIKRDMAVLPAKEEDVAESYIILRDKINNDRTELCKCLNDLADIISSYEYVLLCTKNHSRVWARSPWTNDLSLFMEDFAKSLGCRELDFIKPLKSEIVRRLSPSLALVHWTF